MGDKVYTLNKAQIVALVTPQLRALERRLDEQERRTKEQREDLVKVWEYLRDYEDDK